MKRKFTSSALFCFLYFTINAVASDIVEVLPVTNRILLVHFDDGYTIPHKKGQKRSDESAVIDPLDVTRAMLATSYALSSSNDAFYATAKNPTSIGRKSKGTEYANLCEEWGGASVGCQNTSPDHTKEHWIYLILPEPLQKGKTYTLATGTLAKNKTAVTFTFDETRLRSETIHVNNLGYSTAAPAKYAYLHHWMGDKGGVDLSAFVGQEFKIVKVADRQPVFTGKIAFRKDKTNAETNQSDPNETPNRNFAAADVYECDFSAFTTSGEYVLSVEGIGCSFPFKIDADVFREAYFWTMKGLYQNRSGIELKTPCTEYPRPAPHHPKLTPGFAGRLKYTTARFFDFKGGDADPADKPVIEAGAKGALTDTWGWYQDAGDWDAYYSHSQIPAELMFVYEAARNKFTDNELNIPESGNGLPDMLDEAAWLLHFYKRAKDEIKTKGWGTGGVPGARVFGDLWGGDEREGGITQGSWEDTGRDWYVSGEDPWMSYKYAALAAQMAYILASEGKTDPQQVDWVKEAVDAYAWAKNNTKAGDENPKQGASLREIRAYAAAALYRATGAGLYHNQFLADASALFTGNALDGGKLDLMFAAWTYLQMPANRSTNADLKNKIKTGVMALADEELVKSAEQRAARWGGNMGIPMLVGQPTTPMVISGVYGYIAAKTDNPAKAIQYLKYLHTTADYFLGANPLNMTWITGVGDRSPAGLFRMDWFYGPNSDKIIKGFVPYGPWRVESWQEENKGPWFNSFAYKTLYPAIGQWPGHERWFNPRYGFFPCEFTVHQNSVVSAFVYGFLTQDKETKPLMDVPENPLAVEKKSELENKILIYPNPTDGHAFIQLSEPLKISQIDVFALNGQKVLSVTDPRVVKDKIELQTKTFKNGGYVVKFRATDGRSVCKELIISR